MKEEKLPKEGSVESQNEQGQDGPELSEVGKLEAEIEALKAELEAAKDEAERWKAKFEGIVIRSAVVQQAAKSGAKDAELIYELLAPKCHLEETDGGYQVIVGLEEKAKDGSVQIKRYELKEAVEKLLEKYPYLRASSNARGAGSKNSDLAPITMESLKSMSLDELRARKSELERLARMLIG